jgi:hypothetical protein
MLINSTLINSDSIEPLQSWLNPTNLLPIFVVVIGAYFTYIYASRLEDRRNKFNLKVKIYLDVLDQIQSLKMHKDSVATLMEIPKNDNTEKKIRDESEKIGELLVSLYQHIAKLQIVCSRDVMTCFAEFYTYTTSTTSQKIDTNTLAIKMIKLSRAMRKDLGANEKELDWLSSPEETKNLWQFRK